MVQQTTANQATLFGDSRPLAERLRPQSLADFIGQEHLLGRGKFLHRLLESKQLPSLILWGPPGTGKTTLARLLARNSGSEFIFFSAVLTGVKEIRKIISLAEEYQRQGKSTVLFVDEIHRFNKGQQDGFLPYVENGLITLIGATTENPSFEVVAPLLSRCRVLTLQRLTDDDLLNIGKRAIDHPVHGLNRDRIIFAEEALQALVTLADGDARRLLNNIEVASALVKGDEENEKVITREIIAECFNRRNLQYDKSGEEHYNQISALHKSLRDSDPDGALYWLCRMLEAGEDPLYTARRMIRFASEDIGNADPQALQIALLARDSFQMLGSPEGELALAQAVLYLATAPKSNAVYLAYNTVRRDIAKTGSLPVPHHIRNAPTGLMKELGYGKGYQYAHDDPLALVDQDHLPDKLCGQRYYHPTDRGAEKIVKQRLEKWRAILAARKKSRNQR
ncbi:MAG: AAA family ATPase [Desulfobulbaceae bacterium]|nr:MAG: AAA family ATPase [Desulfobulbaceae bacterium]